MCRKTGIYATLKEARRAIRYMKGKGYAKLIPYYCHWCHAYHVSSDNYNKKHYNPNKTKYKLWKAKR